MPQKIQHNDEIGPLEAHLLNFLTWQLKNNYVRAFKALLRLAIARVGSLLRQSTNYLLSIVKGLIGCN